MQIIYKDNVIVQDSSCKMWNNDLPPVMKVLLYKEKCIQTCSKFILENDTTGNSFLSICQVNSI